MPGAARASASRTSSSTSSASRRSCCRSTRPPASQYGVRWEVLAAINEIETDYGRNLNVSSAGARRAGCSSCPRPGSTTASTPTTTASRTPTTRPTRSSPPPATCSAAGAEQDLRKAIFAYNHADWYVDSVLLRARADRRPARRPRRLAHRADPGPLPGRRQGARYADDVIQAASCRKVAGQNAAHYVVEVRTHRHGIKIFARRGAPVIAVNDGRIVRIGHTKRLGRFVQLQDVYGNTYTYARLDKVAQRYPAPKPRTSPEADRARSSTLAAPRTPSPTAPASRPPGPPRRRKPPAGRQARGRRARRRHRSPRRPRRRSASVTAKQRLFANPARPDAARAGGARADVRAHRRARAAARASRHYLTQGLRPRPQGRRLKRLRPGSRVVAGTILGRIGRRRASQAPHVLFEIRPAGRGAPRIDPKPILDGWKLLESTAIYRAAGKNPFFGPDAENPSIGQILLMSKEALSAPRARQPAHRRSTPAAATTSAPARSTAACWRRSSSSPPPASSRRSRR